MKKVLVLLSSYNGEQYIEEQINSLLKQENVSVKILIRDDGSTDRTISIVQQIQKDHKNIELIKGANLGYAKSFMTLVHLAGGADFYAFCDQDDFWLKNKLSIAVSHIEKDKEPALYLSQARVVNSELEPIEVTFHKRKVTLGAVLEHNYAIGCTMVFNEELRKLLDINLDEMCLTCGHDSWTYLVALAIDAKVYFDLEGYVLYRQHGTNASGKIVSVKQAIRAINKLLFKWKNARCETATKLLMHYKSFLSEPNRDLLYDAANYRKKITSKTNLLSKQEMLSDYFVVDFLYRFAVLFNLF